MHHQGHRWQPGSTPSAGGGGPTLFEAIMADAPLAYWRGPVPQPPTIGDHVDDSSGNGLWLEVWRDNANPTYPQNGASLDASDGSNPSFVFTPNSNIWSNTAAGHWPALDLNDQVTITTIIQPDAAVLDATDHDIVRKANQYGLRIDSTGHIAGFVDRAGDSLRQIVGPVVVAETRYHVHYTYDGVDARLYVNGAEVAHDGPRADAAINTGGVNFALSQWGAPANAFSGQIDEVAIFNVALSAARVLAHYTAGKP